MLHAVEDVRKFLHDWAEETMVPELRTKLRAKMKERLRRRIEEITEQLTDRLIEQAMDDLPERFADGLIKQFRADRQFREELIGLMKDRKE